MISRDLENVIGKNLFKGKAIILLGARQTGKTTLVKSIIKSTKY
jgi:predicted AAA+ superfamily ATPase